MGERVSWLVGRGRERSKGKRGETDLEAAEGEVGEGGHGAFVGICR